MSINMQNITNVKIISEGFGDSGTKVLLEDGTPIKGITAVRITVEAGKLVKAELDVCVHSYEIQAQLDSINVRKVEVDKKPNLYLVKPVESHESESYARYLGFVICADNEDEAKDLSFEPTYQYGCETRLDHWNWVPEGAKHLLTVKYLGIADSSIQKGKILGDSIND